MFQVIISAPPSTMFFTRSKEDTFSVNIEEINKGTYDPLKLHRVSFFLDVGLEHGTPMGFGFDGSLIIPKDRSVSTADSAIDSFNRVKAALLLGGVPIDATTPSMIGFGELKSTGYFRYHDCLGAEALIAQALQERGAGSQVAINLLRPPELTEEEVRSAFYHGERTFSALPRLNAAFLAQAYSSLRKHEARKALIFGWVACEQLLESLWQDFFLKEPRFYRFESRLAYLKNVRHVAEKIEFLFLSDLIPEDIYSHITAARKSRNKFAHSGGEVEMEHAQSCVKGMLMLIEALSALHGRPFNMGEIFETLEPQKRPRPTRIGTAKDVDWSSVAFYKELIKIPGDESWEDGGTQVDGILLQDISDEVRKRVYEKKKNK